VRHSVVRVLVAALGVALALLFFIGGIVRHRRWLAILVRRVRCPTRH
jgi:hypothetical protein